jgi:hypothetical protein
VHARCCCSVSARPIVRQLRIATSAPGPAGSVVHQRIRRDIVRSYMGLLVQGKSDFDAIENFRGDKFYKQALGIELLPSSPTLRQRMDAMAAELFEYVPQLNEALLAGAKPDVGVLPCGWLALDIDTFAMDNGGTSKDGVGRTYAGVDGYCPLAAYLGSGGWCLELALRPGTQHSACETEFNLESIIPMAQRLSAGGDEQASQDRRQAADGHRRPVRSPGAMAVGEALDPEDVAWGRPRVAARRGGSTCATWPVPPSGCASPAPSPSPPQQGAAELMDLQVLPQQQPGQAHRHQGLDAEEGRAAPHPQARQHGEQGRDGTAVQATCCPAPTAVPQSAASVRADWASERNARDRVCVQHRFLLEVVPANPPSRLDLFVRLRVAPRNDLT